jgi:HEAT repeat protein
MDLFLFLVIAILCSVFLFSFLYPSLADQEEEEDEEHLDSTEMRLDVLLQGVVDPRADVRERHRNRILSMGPAVIPRLTAQLSQELFLEHNQIKILRLEELLQDFGQRAIPALLQLLQDEGNDPTIAYAASELLRRLGPSAGPFLLERYRKPVNKHLRPILLSWGKRALRDAMDMLRLDPQRREWNDLFAGWLQSTEASDAAHALIEAYQKSPQPAKQRALELLSHTPPPQSAAFLRDLSTSKDTTTRRLALQGLAYLADPSVLLFCQDSDTSIRHQAFQALADERYTEMSKQIIETLQEQRTEALGMGDLKGVALCETTLCRWTQTATPSIIQRLFEASEYGLRRQALVLSAHLAADEYTSYLKRALLDAQESLYTEALHQIAQTHPPQSTEILFHALEQRAEDASFLEAAQTCLSSLGKVALRPLRRLLANENKALFSAAFHALLQMEDKELLYEILEILQEPSTFSRLEDFDFRDIRRFLRRLFKQPTVDYTVNTFLQRFPETPLRALLEESLERFHRSAEQREPLSFRTESEG